MIEENKKILKNLSYLTILQVGNYVIPFLLLPYLIKVLGIEYFGLVSFMQALMINLSILTDYGFNISTIGLVSLNRDDNEYLSILYSEVFFAKIFLFLPCLLLLTICILFIPSCSNHPYVSLASFTIVIGNTLLPIWLFQGMEQMRFTTIFTLVAKLFFALLTLIIVHGPQDFFWVMILQGVGGIAASLAAMYFIKYKWGISINALTGIKGVKNRLQQSWHFFVSNASIALYANTNVIILGMFASNKVVGLYSIAEKIMQTIRVLLTVYTLSVYPHVCLLISQGRGKLIIFFRKMYLPFLTGICFLSLLAFIFAPFMARFLTKVNQDQLTTFIRILVFVPPVVCMNIPFNLIMLAKNFKNSYAKILFFVAVVLIISSTISAYFFGALGVCFSSLAAEILATTLLFASLNIKYKFKFKL